jgi:hypothetical protein
MQSFGSRLGNRLRILQPRIPIEIHIMLVFQTRKQTCYFLLQNSVIRFLLILQTPGILQQFIKLLWQALANLIDTHRHFRMQNLRELLLYSLRSQILPRQLPLQKVNQNVYQRFDIVSSTVLYSCMDIYARITHSTPRMLTISKFQMFPAGGHVFTRVSEIRHKQQM